MFTFMRNYVVTFAKSLVVGSTMLVPGVSGGSMAMILGIYTKLISSVSSFMKNKFRNSLFLTIFLAGSLIGIVSFSKPILHLIETYPMPMLYFFMGAVAGSVPLMFREAKLTKFSWTVPIYVAIGFLIVLFFEMSPISNVTTNDATNWYTYLLLVVAGFIAAIALVLPGISVSYMLLLMGLYDETMRAAAFQDLFSLGGSTVDNEVGIFKSKRLMRTVVETLHLDISYKEWDGLRKKELYTSTPFAVTFLDATPSQQISLTVTMSDNGKVTLADMTLQNEEEEEEFDEILTVQPGDTVNTPVGKMVVASTLFTDENSIGKTVYVTKGNMKEVAESYNKALNVGVANKQSSLIALSIEDENVQRAEDLLNTLIEVYKNDAIEDKNRIVINTARFIGERLEIIEADLAAVDAEIENYKKKNRLTDIASESALYLQSSSMLDTEGLSVENQLNMAQYMKEYLQDNSKTTELVPASIGIDDMGVQNLIMEYNTVLTRRNKLIANSSANNPLVRDLNGTLMSMRLSIAKAVDNLIASLEIQVANMKNKERENSNKIAFVPTQLKYVVSIERQQKIKEELYLFLLNKKEENELQLSITESNCRIIDPAEGVDLPVAPKKAQVALIALLAGIMLPALWIYIRSLLNTSVHTKKELKAGVNIPFLGEVPLEKNKHEKDIVVQEGSRESICEAFKIVRDNLDFMDTEKKTVGKVVLVTSANPDSGKTFITLNLGMSMALANVKVVILDLDLRKGSLSKSVGIGMKKTGVSNYLSGKVDDVKELVQVCGDDNRLHIITSGALPPNPAELLKSGRLDRLLEELKKNYDYILLDNPPYGVVVDTQLCGRLADQTVYVVRSGLFDKRMLPELQELYDSGKMKNMSILLNGIDYVKTGYGYGYGYGYGNYGNDENRKNKKPLYKRIFGI